MSDVNVNDYRLERHDTLLRGDIVKIEGESDRIWIYLDSGYMISISKGKIIEFLMLDKLEKSK